MATTITYDGTNLNDGTTLITSEVEESGSFDRNLPLFNRARRSGAVITDSLYQTKTIRVSGKIIGASVDDLENEIDDFHALFTVQDKNLDIGYNSGTRRYICTARTVNVTRPVRAATWANFFIDFVSTEYGRDTAVTTLENATAFSSSPTTKSLTIDGNAPEQFLRIELELVSVTAATTNTVTLENDTTGEILTIQRTWAAADTLVVDTDLLDVTVEGTDVAFTGAIPNFAPGSHDLILTADFSAFDFDVTVDHYKRWL